MLFAFIELMLAATAISLYVWLGKDGHPVLLMAAAFALVMTGFCWANRVPTATRRLLRSDRTRLKWVARWQDIARLPANRADEIVAALRYEDKMRREEKEACSGCAGITHVHSCRDPNKQPKLDGMELASDHLRAKRAIYDGMRDDKPAIYNYGERWPLSPSPLPRLSVRDHCPRCGGPVDGPWRAFDTTKTKLERWGRVFTITCDDDETANRVADQIHTRRAIDAPEMQNKGGET